MCPKTPFGWLFSFYFLLFSVDLLGAETASLQVLPASAAEEYMKSLDHIETQYASRLQAIINENYYGNFPFVCKEFKDKFGVKALGLGFKNPLQKKYEEMAAEIMSTPLDEEIFKECKAKIPQGTPPPSITLVAEIHPCPNCHIERLNRILDARAGEFTLIEEGEENKAENKSDDINEAESSYFTPVLANLPQSEAKVYGLESYTKELSTMSGLIVDLLQSGDAKIKEPTNFNIDKIEDGDLDQEKYSTTLNAITNLIFGDNSGFHLENIEEIAKSDTEFREKFQKPLLQLKEKLTTVAQKEDYMDDFFNSYKEFFSQFSYKDISSYFQKILLKELLKAASESPEMEKSKPTLFAFLHKTPYSNLDWKLLRQVIVMPLKNREYASNIIQHYCAHSFGSEKASLVQIGALHAPGVKFLIENAFKAAGVPAPAVPIEQDAQKFLAMPYREKQKHIQEGLHGVDQRLQKIMNTQMLSSQPLP